MKKMKTIVNSFALMCLLALFYGFMSNHTAQDTYSNIGDVKISILPPDVFNQTQEGNWVVMDGKYLSEDTNLYKIMDSNSKIDLLPTRNGKTIIPDLRGKFIRSMNINGEGNDPEKNRTVGSYQADRIIQHQHTGYFPVNSGYSFEHHQVNSRLKGQSNTKSTGGVTGAKSTTETRPKNIALYTYIKIAN